VRLSEPTTAITDYILGVELLLLGSLLAGSSSQISVRLWAASFLVMAVAAIAGGTFHAGRFTFHASLLQRLWNSAGIGIALSSGLLLAAGAMSASGVLRSMLLPASVVVAIMISRGFSTPSGQPWKTTTKTVVVLFLALFVLLLIHLLKNGSPAGIWILAGSLIAGAAIGIQRAGLMIHRRFNHNDLFHVVMMAAYYVLYRGGLLLRDQ